MKEHRGWLTLSGEKITSIWSAVDHELVQCPDFSEPYSVEIGTDSQQTKLHTVFVTVVVVRRPSKGARVFYRVARVKRISSLRNRLMEESWRSLDVAWSLMDHGLGYGHICIHVDANTKPEEESAKYAQELAGMIVGQGFSVRLKPDGWAASRVADYAIKKRVLVQ